MGDSIQGGLKILVLETQMEKWDFEQVCLGQPFRVFRCSDNKRCQSELLRRLMQAKKDLRCDCSGKNKDEIG